MASKPAAWFLCLFLLATAISARGAYPFWDDGESGAGQWSATPPWALTTEAAHSATHAYTDSPGTNYANGADLSLAMASNLDLVTAIRPRLSFWHKYALENGFDFGLVEISLDGGGSWIPAPLATYTGSSGWRREEVDLSAYAGQPTVRIRFRLTSDGTVTFTFRATAVSLSALLGPDQGIASVTLDGAPAGTVDLYAAAVEHRGWVFHSSGLTDAVHTLVFEVTGTQNGASSGAAVNLDGYLFGR